MCLAIAAGGGAGLALDPNAKLYENDRMKSPCFWFLAAAFFCCFSMSVFAQSDQQVTMEINAVQIVLNDEHRQGVDWEAIVSDFHTLQLKMPDDPGWVDKKYKVDVGTLSKDDYAVLLEALDTVGQMTQVPQPSVILPLDLKQNVNVALTDQKTAHVRLDLTLVELKEQLELHLEPFVEATLKDSSGGPVSVMLKGQTAMALQDGMTIVIGGITSEHEITTTHKFPILGDLPLVGLVFRNQGRLMQKTETVVFLTPRLKAVQINDK